MSTSSRFRGILAGIFGNRKTFSVVLLGVLLALPASAYDYKLKVVHDIEGCDNLFIKYPMMGFGNNPVLWDCLQGVYLNCVGYSRVLIEGRGGSVQLSTSNAFSEDFKMKLTYYCGSSNSATATAATGLISKNNKDRIVILHGYDGEVTWGENANHLTTGWLDHDNPGSPGNGNHDWEKLHLHMSDGNIPSVLHGIEPAYVAMRTTGTHQDVFDTGDDVHMGTSYGGKVKNDSGNPAADDYEIEFQYGWTPWLSFDNDPSDGEDEGRWRVAGIQTPVSAPKFMECRIKGTDDYGIGVSATSTSYYYRPWGTNGETVLVRADVEDGCRCYNEDQNGTLCATDLEARYYHGYEKICDGNTDDGTDNGRCDASAGAGAKLVAGWNSSYCLDVAGVDSTANGTNIQLWSCSGAGERWRFNLETGRIHAAWDPSMCLDVAGLSQSDNNRNVQLWSCDEVTETWSLDENTGKLVAQWDNDVCLDIVGTNSTSNGTNAGIYQCDRVTETWRLDF